MDHIAAPGAYILRIIKETPNHPGSQSHQLYRVYFETEEDKHLVLFFCAIAVRGGLDGITDMPDFKAKVVDPTGRASKLSKFTFLSLTRCADEVTCTPEPASRRRV